MGADYYHDPDGTMVSQPKKYIEKLKETYIRLFNTEPSKGLKTPLEKNDHPGLDTSDILEGQQVNHNLTMVGKLQWLIAMWGDLTYKLRLFQCLDFKHNQDKDTWKD